jgi:chaperonin GroEL (HSP60 family)
VINVKKGTVTDMREQNVVQPLLVTKERVLELARRCE